MKSSVIKAFVAAATIAVAMPAMAQFNVGKAIGAGVKAAKAATLTRNNFPNSKLYNTTSIMEYGRNKKNI